MSDTMKCPYCGSENVVEWGQVECDDEMSLSLFCEEWLCKSCNQTFVGGMVFDELDDWSDDWSDDE